MKIVGVIVEYNPFHNGHKYHLELAKKITGADYVIGIMSGNFVQRGIPAITDKYTRTQMALQNGADAIFELPVYYATASAETFAYGAVSILDGLKKIDYLVFGGENDNLPVLREIAHLLLEQPEEYEATLQTSLRAGATYPAAREQALKAIFPSRTDYLEILSTPNNILGIEYIKALLRRNSSIEPIILKRQGAGYHDPQLETNGQNPSATALRNDYENHQILDHYAGFIPENCLTLLKEQEHKTFPISIDDFSEYFYYKLNTITLEELLTFTDVTEELAFRIINNRQEFGTLSTFAALIKTRQYTLTRIQRVLLHILLNHKATTPPPYYGKLLGFQKSASQILQKVDGQIPVITKTADGRDYLQDDIFASNLYNRVIKQKFFHTIKDDYRHPLVIL